MSTARIITQNPESTETLAAYLRAEGYDVVYAQPGEPQPGSGELAIVVEACRDQVQAVGRARELAALRGCDVFVGEGIVERLDFESFEAPEAVPGPEEPGAALETPAYETPAYEEAEFISGQSGVTSPPQAPPPLVSPAKVSSAEVRYSEPPAQLGFRALRAAKELLGLHLAALLEGARK